MEPWWSGALQVQRNLRHFVTFDFETAESHVIPWDIPWNSMEPRCHLKWALQITWHSMELSDNLFGKGCVPWNSMELTLCQIKWNSMEYNSMELCYIWFGGGRDPWNSMEYSMKFHWTLLSIEMAPSQIHEIPWNFVTFYLAKAEFHGIPWNIPWNLWHLTWCYSSWMQSHGTLWHLI